MSRPEWPAGLTCSLGAKEREHGQDTPMGVGRLVDAQLGEHLGHVRLHGAVGHEESPADRLVGTALGDP